jgi:hypothetical protein
VTLGLHRFHGHGVGDQQHVRLGLAGLDLGQEAGHDLRRAVAHELDGDVRVRRHERVDGLLRVLVGLAGVERERHVLRGGGQREEHEREGDGQAVHGRSFRWAVRGRTPIGPPDDA